MGIFPEMASSARAPAGWRSRCARGRGAARRLGGGRAAGAGDSSITGRNFRAWPRYAGAPRPAASAMRYHHRSVSPPAYRGPGGGERRCLPCWASCGGAWRPSLLPGVRGSDHSAPGPAPDARALSRQAVRRVAASGGGSSARCLSGDDLLPGGTMPAYLCLSVPLHLDRLLIPASRPAKGPLREAAPPRCFSARVPARRLSGVAGPRQSRRTRRRCRALVLAGLFPSTLLSEGARARRQSQGQKCRRAVAVEVAALALAPGVAMAPHVALPRVPGRVRLGEAHGLLRLHGPDPGGAPCP